MSIQIFAILVSAYLVGSIPFSYLVTKIFNNSDIREEGSGNAGARNVARVAGRGWGILTGILDVGKGALPVAFLCRAGYGGHTVLASGCLLVAGHNWSPYLSLKGGNGLAVSLGIMASLAFRVTAFAVLALLFLGWLGGKIPPLSAFMSPLDLEVIFGYFLFPVLLFLSGMESWIVVMPLLLGLVMLPKRVLYLRKTENDRERERSFRSPEKI